MSRGGVPPLVLPDGAATAMQLQHQRMMVVQPLGSWAADTPERLAAVVAAGLAAAGDALAGGGAVRGVARLVGVITAVRVHGRGLMFCDIRAADGGGGGGSSAGGGGAAFAQLAMDARRGALDVACGGDGGGAPCSYEALAPLLAPGAIVRAEGEAGMSRSGRHGAAGTGLPTLFVRTLVLLRAAPEASAVARVCAMVSDGAMPLEVGAGLLDAPPERVAAAAAAGAAGDPCAGREAVRLARRLAGAPEARPPRVRSPRVTARDVALLAALGPARDAWPVAAVPQRAGDEDAPWVAALLDPAACVPDAGDARRTHYVATKKRPQVVWMVRQVCACVRWCGSVDGGMLYGLVTVRAGGCTRGRCVGCGSARGRRRVRRRRPNRGRGMRAWGPDERAGRGVAGC